jgi:two-component system sensor histidine kinase KdpD
MASVRQQTRVAGARERRTALLYAMSRELAATRDLPALARVAVTHVSEVFDSHAAILLPDASGRLRHPDEAPLACSLRSADLSIAQWVADHGQRAGLGSDTLPAAPALYLPLPGSSRTLGVLAVQAENRRRVLLPEQRHLLETFAGQIALAMERIQLAHEAESSRIEAETESLRNTLLASISHDLRTPLAVIAGAGSTLADAATTLDTDSRRQLAQSIEDRARDMSDLISNVLDLTRLESDSLVLRRDWQTIDDLVGAALERCATRMRDHRVGLTLPEDLPAVHVDATLIVQLFANLLENAAKYTPPGTLVTISARADGGRLHVVVADEGPGLPAADPDRLFDKFQRGRSESEIAGAGLGLAICRAIARAHHGDIHAANRAEGGARFEVTLPIEEPAG